MEKAWLDEDRVESDLKKQQAISASSAQARSDHIREMRALQRRADILLKLWDQENIQVLESGVTNALPKGKFAYSDLARFFPTDEAPKPIDLVVVIVPDTFPYEEGKPSELGIIRILDRVLRQGGVKRRVFQIFGPTHFCELDSAAVY